MEPDSPASWSEDDSALYRSLARVAVPAREEMLASLLALIPFGVLESSRIVELGSGEGLLARALLEVFPAAQVVALDGSAAMRQATAEALGPHRRRARIESFDLLDLEPDAPEQASPAWLDHLEGAAAVVSSLCVHHLSGVGKRALFSAAADRLAPGGALLVLDLVEPESPRSRALWAQEWDRIAEKRAQRIGGGEEALARFHREGWNLYRHPDPVDRPSPLGDQLRWLQEAGLVEVEAFALVAGHALFGGRCKGADDLAGSGSGRDARERIRAVVERLYGAAGGIPPC